MNNGHAFFMERCYQLAAVAKERGDSPVGSVIVLDNAIIAEGIEGNKTHNDITFHAEIEAIRQAVIVLGKQDLSGCILYTTHEPCIMCSYVIRHTRITTVVIDMLTGDTGGYSSQMPVLKDTSVKKWGAPPEVIIFNP